MPVEQVQRLRHRVTPGRRQVHPVPRQLLPIERPVTDVGQPLDQPRPGLVPKLKRDPPVLPDRRPQLCRVRFLLPSRLAADHLQLRLAFPPFLLPLRVRVLRPRLVSSRPVALRARTRRRRTTRTPRPGGAARRRGRLTLHRLRTLGRRSGRNERLSPRKKKRVRKHECRQAAFAAIFHERNRREAKRTDSARKKFTVPA